jgi:hypothetical protein
MVSGVSIIVPLRMILSLTGLCLLSLAHVMMRPVEPNEHMYLAAYVLSIDHTLYKDFAFLQMPVIALIHGLIFKLTGTTYALLIARLVAWVGLLAVLFLLWKAVNILIPRSNQKTTWTCGEAAAWVLLLSENFIIASGEASNYVWPLLFVLFAYIRLRNSLEKSPKSTACLVGFCLAIAVGMKLYFVLFAPLFLIAVSLRSDEIDSCSWLKRSSLYLVGFVIGSLPSLYYMAICFEPFMFENLYFHWETADWYRSMDYPDRMTLFQRVQYAKGWFQHGSQMWLVWGSIAALLYTIKLTFENPIQTIALLKSIWLEASLVLVALVASLMPIPAWPQYFSMPIPFALLFFGAMINRLCQMESRSVEHNASLESLPTLVAVVAGLFVSGTYFARAFTQALEPSNWVEVATFANVMAIEAGATIYPELAAANFFFQIGDGLPNDKLSTYKTTSPSQLFSFLDKKAPRLILVRNNSWGSGTARSPDLYLKDYAQSRPYHGILSANYTLYIRTHRAP